MDTNTNTEPNFNRCEICGVHHATGHCPALERPASMTAQQTIEDRENSHGDYKVQAGFSQQLKGAMRNHPGWINLNDCQRESMDMIAVKMSRVLTGDPNTADHWTDIAGYATLVSNLITKGHHL